MQHQLSMHALSVRAGSGWSGACEAREAFYGSEGRWALFVCELGPRPVDALRVLCAALPITRSEVMEIVRERRPARDGALAELEGLEAMLEEVGAEVELRRLPD
jgi:hypothetical protein